MLFFNLFIIAALPCLTAALPTKSVARDFGESAKVAIDVLGNLAESTSEGAAIGAGTGLILGGALGMGGGPAGSLSGAATLGTVGTVLGAATGLGVSAIGQGGNAAINFIKSESA